MNKEAELQQLSLVARQIKQIGQYEGLSKVVDETNQVLQCLLSAVWELENPQPDSEEFISDVVDQSRDRLEKLLVQINAVPEDFFCADTERSPMKFD